MADNGDAPKVAIFLCCAQVMPFDRIHDMAGFLICPEHHERLYGWRSQEFRPGRLYSGMTQLERDQARAAELFGESNDA